MEMQNINGKVEENTVSMQNDKMYTFDIQYSDFEDADPVEAYNDNEWVKNEWNDDMNDVNYLNDPYKGDELLTIKIMFKTTWKLINISDQQHY